MTQTADICARFPDAPPVLIRDQDSGQTQDEAITLAIWYCGHCASAAFCEAQP